MGLRENLLTTMASWMENQEETNKLEEEGSDEVIATTFQNARDMVLFWLEDDYQWFLDSYWPEDGEVVGAEEMIGVLRSITPPPGLRLFDKGSTCIEKIRSELTPK